MSRRLYICYTLPMPISKEQQQRSHLEFIELLRTHRLEEVLGRTGPTHVPVDKVKNITNLQLDNSLESLMTDRLILTYPKGKKYKKESFNGKPHYVFNLLKTADEIADYERSLEKDGLIVHIYKTGYKYEMYLNGYPVKRQLLSASEAGLLLFLITHEGEPLKKDIIIRDARRPNGCRYRENEVSNFASSIRRKLKRIGIPASEMDKIYPSYYGGEGCTFNKDKRVLFGAKNNFYLD